MHLPGFPTPQNPFRPRIVSGRFDWSPTWPTIWRLLQNTIMERYLLWCHLPGGTFRGPGYIYCHRKSGLAASKDPSPLWPSQRKPNPFNRRNTGYKTPLSSAIFYFFPKLKRTYTFQVPKKTKLNRCGRCGVSGHNMTNCTVPI